MAKSDTPKGVKCSFCGKTQDSVRKIVAGPGVYICNECIGLCNEIIESEYRTYIAPEMWGTHYFDANGHETCMDDCEEFVTQHLKELHFPFGSEADATLV